MKSKKKPLKLRKKEKKGSANLKSAVGEVAFSAFSYFKERKQDKVTVAADTAFSQHVVNSSQAKKKSVWAGKIICWNLNSLYSLVRIKEYAGTYQRICWIQILNPKFNKYFFLAQFWGTIEKRAPLVPPVPISRPITPLSSLCEVETASPHQNRIVTQNQEFQINGGNKWSRKLKQTFKYCFFMFFYNAS